MCRKVSLCICVILLICAVDIAVGDGPVIHGETATASTEGEHNDPTRTAMKSVDNSGLDETGTYHHGRWWDQWCGGGNDNDVNGHTNPNPGTEVGAEWLRIDLGTTYELDFMWIWNWNPVPEDWSPYLPYGIEYSVNRGLRWVTIEYSTTGGSDFSEWTKLGSYEWIRADYPGDDFYVGFEGASFDYVDARYIVITANDVNGNYGGVGQPEPNGIPHDMSGYDPNLYYGLAEVQFFGGLDYASSPYPVDGEQTAEAYTNLIWAEGWTGGAYAPWHDVYIGTSQTEVDDANRVSHPGVTLYQDESEISFALPELPLELETIYYWRVDEFNDLGWLQAKGETWEFAVDDHYSNVIKANLKTGFVERASAGKGIVHTSAGHYEAGYDAGPNRTIDGSGLSGDLHNNYYIGNMWMGNMGVEPNSYNAGCVAGENWIAYEFGRVYNLGEMWVWNYNNYYVPDDTGHGLKNVTIQYSVTGGSESSEWTTLNGGLTQFNKAPSPGLAGYAHNTEVDFGGAQAKYVVITPDFGVGNGWWGPLSWYVGLSEVRFHYIVPFATFPSPADAEMIEDADVVLSWSAGEDAVSQKVYFGTSSTSLDLVAELPAGTVVFDPNDPEDDLTELQWGRTYYWRVETTDSSAKVHRGNVWSFTEQPYVVVDDMETSPSPLFSITANGTVSIETNMQYVKEIQSLKFDYDNSSGLEYSEAEAQIVDLPTGADWTIRDMKVLSVSFYGDPGNALEQMYVVLDDGDVNTAIPYDGDMNDIQQAEWTMWNIELADFGVTVNSIDSISLGFGDRSNPTTGGAGTVYFDNIRLYVEKCMYMYAGDVIGQGCIVDEADLRQIASEWLTTGSLCDLNDDNIVNFKDYTIMGQDWLKNPIMWP